MLLWCVLCTAAHVKDHNMIPAICKASLATAGSGVMTALLLAVLAGGAVSAANLNDGVTAIGRGTVSSAVSEHARALPAATPNPVPSAQLAALLDLYDTTNGDDWTSVPAWVAAGTDPCQTSWTAMSCESATGNVMYVTRQMQENFRA